MVDPNGLHQVVASQIPIQQAIFSRPIISQVPHQIDSAKQMVMLN